MRVFRKAPPKALLLAGDWSHRVPQPVQLKAQTQDLERSLDEELEALTKATELWIPLYSERPDGAEIRSLRAPATVLAGPGTMPWHRILWWPPAEFEPVTLVRHAWQETSRGAAPWPGSRPARAWLANGNTWLATLPVAMDGIEAWTAAGDGVGLGSRKVSVDGRFWPRAHLKDLLRLTMTQLDRQDARQWQDRVVILAPAGDSQARDAAVALSSWRQGDFDWRPVWSGALVVVLSLIWMFYLWLIDRKLAWGTSLLALALLTLLFAMVQYGLAAMNHWWLPLGVWSAWMLVSYALARTGFVLLSRLRRWLVLRDQAHQMMAQVSREKGERRAAFGYLKACQPVRYTQDLLMELAQDMERRREYADAVEVYRYLVSVSESHRRQLAGRIERLQQAADAGTRDRPVDGGQTLVMTSSELHRPELGRYQIEKVIGQGAMGVVYLGRDPKIGRSVAIKTLTLSSEFSGEELEEAKARFHREAETAGRLRHPNIVTVYDVGEEQDLAYIAMDFLRGRPLSDFVRKESLLPVPTVFHLMAQVADALAYAHGEGIVHRDIKPANMMYDAEQEQVVVTDFGIAFVTDNSKTRTGTILGSPYYMAPEQIEGKKVDGRADIFSLGVSLYQLLTGELPFQGDNLAALAYAIAKQDPPSVTGLRKGLPRGTVAVLKKALEKKREKRYQQASDMADALRKLMSASGGRSR
jgi:serine/threonine-protein kinase